MLEIALLVAVALSFIMSVNDAKTIKRLRAENNELKKALEENANKEDVQNEE